jgi:hypothetical protein
LTRYRRSQGIIGSPRHIDTIRAKVVERKRPLSSSEWTSVRITWPL